MSRPRRAATRPDPIADSERFTALAAQGSLAAAEPLDGSYHLPVKDRDGGAATFFIERSGADARLRLSCLSRTLVSLLGNAWFPWDAVRKNGSNCIRGPH